MRNAAARTTKLSTKGQIILPKSVRDSCHWPPGTEFTVEEVAGGVLLRPRRPFRRTRLQEVSGCLRYAGKAKTLAEMARAIPKGVKERHARGRF